MFLGINEAIYNSSGVTVYLHLGFRIDNDRYCLNKSIGRERTSLTSTMLGWWKESRMLISRMDVSGKPSFSFSMRTFFRAQMRFVLFSRALSP